MTTFFFSADHKVYAHSFLRVDGYRFGCQVITVYKPMPNGKGWVRLKESVDIFASREAAVNAFYGIEACAKDMATSEHPEMAQVQRCVELALQAQSRRKYWAALVE